MTQNDNKKQKNRFGINIQRTVMYFCGLVSVFIVLCCCFAPLAKQWAMMYMTAQNYPTIVLIVPGILFFAVIMVCVTALNKLKISRRVKIVLYIIFNFILFFLHVIVIRSYYFHAAWDANAVIQLADSLAHGEDVSFLNHYYSFYPNNLFLGSIFAIIRKAVHIIGLHNYEYFMLIVVQCILCELAGYFVFKIIRKITGDNVAALYGQIIYVLIVWSSPWISVPYSDSFGLIIPITIIYIYAYKDKFKYPIFAWVLISALAMIGYSIKPQTFMAFLAVLVAEVVFFTRKNFKVKTLITALVVVITLACTFMAVAGMKKSTGIIVDKDQTYALPHFLMMGLNYEYMGSWAPNDVGYSATFDNLDERNKADLKEAFRRFRTMGVPKLMILAVRKTISNYNDGTFCWGGEGGFYIRILESDGSMLSQITRGMYYCFDDDTRGEYYRIWSNYAMMVWIACLFFAIFSVLQTPGKELMSISVSIVFITVFELLFECRARYIFAYAPIFIVASSIGIHYLTNLIKLKRPKEKQ